MRILENPELLRMRKRLVRKRILITLVVSFLVLCFCFYGVLVRSGYWLVQDNPFEHVKWAVVLDGQTAEMERTDYAASLLESGKVDSVLILGRRVYRDKNNADFYADDIMRTGSLDSGRIFLWRHNDPSTLEEALSIMPWLKKKSLDTVLLITSAPATRRVAGIFNYLAQGSPTFITVDIKHYTYNPASWMREREIKKLFVREMMAALQAKWDLFWIDPEDFKPRELKKIISLREENQTEGAEFKEMKKAETDSVKVTEESLAKEPILDSLKTSLPATDSIKKP